eukprot:2787039-Alexandrium_andersonii.AAC.1
MPSASPGDQQGRGAQHHVRLFRNGSALADPGPPTAQPRRPGGPAGRGGVRDARSNRRTEGEARGRDCIPP